MIIAVYTNEYNALIIEADGVSIADSTTMRRKRYFWNKLTHTCAPARDFTPAKVAKDPGLVLAYLAKTGTMMVGTVDVRF